MNTETVLSIQKLTKAFGPKVVLPGLDLQVQRGQFVALLGPSGCGKTTLLRLIAGLDRPTSGILASGTITWSGPDHFVGPEHRGLGMVFQSYAVWPHMTVEQNVGYPLKLQLQKGKISRQDLEVRVAKALATVRMGGLEKRFPHQLSGGQQQRVALARALVVEPALLLLDEPLSNLDAKLRAELRAEIRDLHRGTGMTVILVTHDQREALEMATRVLVMNEGRVLQDCTPAQLTSNPQPGFVKEFLAWH